jgi:hypothetical protein
MGEHEYMKSIPRDPRITLLLVLLFALLVVYIVWTRDPIGFVVLALFVAFIALPAVVILVGLRREGRGLRDFLSPHDDEDASHVRVFDSF